MKLVHSKAFTKAYDRLQEHQQAQVDEALRLFAVDRLDPKLRDHALKGKMKHLRSFAAGFDLRVVYSAKNGFAVVFLIDVGTHSQVY
jgi:mRNA interferase YafQ